jgi:hypothetical protein
MEGLGRAGRMSQQAEVVEVGVVMSRAAHGGLVVLYVCAQQQLRQLPSTLCWCFECAGVRKLWAVGGCRHVRRIVCCPAVCPAPQLLTCKPRCPVSLGRNVVVVCSSRLAIW